MVFVKKALRDIDFEVIFYCILVVFISLFIVRNYTHEPSTGKHMLYVLGFGILFLASFLRKKKLEISFTPVHIAFFGFSVASLFSLISLAMDNPQYLIYSADVAIYTVVLALSTIYITTKFRTKLRIELALAAIVVAATLVSINGMLNFYVGYDMISGNIGRSLSSGVVRSTIGNPNFVSSFAGMTIPISIYFVLSPLILNSSQRPSIVVQVILKSFFLVSLIPLVAMLFLCQTRTVFTGTLIAAGLFAGAMLFLYRKADKPGLSKSLKTAYWLFPVMLLALLVVVSVLYLTPTRFTGDGAVSVVSKIESLVQTGGDWRTRVYAWINSVEQIFEPENRLRIVFGTGIGTFQIYHLLYTPNVLFERPSYMGNWSNFKRTHNDYVQGLSETGILGFITILAFVGLMVWFYFRTLVKIKQVDKLLLYAALGASIFVVAFHSLFEFPLHMQPNLMAAIFIVSVAMGPYFLTRTNSLTITRKIWIIPLLLIVSMSAYFKISAFAGEGAYQQGQISMQYYNRYYGQLASNPKASLQEQLRKLDAFEEEYAYLESVQSYLDLKGDEIRQRNPQVTQLELINIADRERRAEIDQIRSQITSSIRRADEIELIMLRHYNEAIESYMRSLELYPVFGRSYWYLGSMVRRPTRMQSAGDMTPSEQVSVLLGDDELASKIIDEFKGNTSIIPLPNSTIRWTPFKDFVDTNMERFLEDATTRGAVNLSFLVQLQMLVDSANYYESSVITFSERQTPRILGQIYRMLFAEGSRYLSIVSQRREIIEQFIEGFDDLIIDLQRLVTRSRELSLYWYDLGTNWLPATWNRYPDWENIYYEHMVAANSMTSGAEESANLLLDIARKHVFACVGMTAESYGIPDDTLLYLYQFARDNLEGSARDDFVGEVASVYEEIVDINRSRLETGPRFSEALQERAERLLSIHEVISQGSF